MNVTAKDKATGREQSISITGSTRLSKEEIDKMMKDEAYTNLAKKERLMLTREKAKLEKQLGGIVDLNRLPAALF